MTTAVRSARTDGNDLTRFAELCHQADRALMHLSDLVLDHAPPAAWLALENARTALQNALDVARLSIPPDALTINEQAAQARQRPCGADDPTT